MNIQNILIVNRVLVVLTGFAVYIYMALSLRKIPDPTTQYGALLDALIVFCIAVLASLITFAVLSLTGMVGYLIEIPIFYLVIGMVLRKMKAGNEKTISA